MLSNTVK